MNEPTTTLNQCHLNSAIAGQALHFCCPQFPHLHNGDDDHPLCIFPEVTVHALKGPACGPALTNAETGAHHLAEGAQAWGTGATWALAAARPQTCVLPRGVAKLSQPQFPPPPRCLPASAWTCALS